MAIVLSGVENKTELSDEGKILNRLLKTSSVPAKERMQQRNDSLGSCSYSLDLSVLQLSVLCCKLGVL